MLVRLAIFGVAAGAGGADGADLGLDGVEIAAHGDLLQLGEICGAQVHQQASAIRAVLVEVSRHPELNDALQHQFLEQRKALMQHILHQAVERGEIAEAAITDELWDLLPGYLIFRSIIPGSPPTRRTVQALVDDFIIPGLTRPRGPKA